MAEKRQSGRLCLKAECTVPATTGSSTHHALQFSSPPCDSSAVGESYRIKRLLPGLTKIQPYNILRFFS
ncbi:Hypothetical predicted protein [Scomber scombrus]|uniref:Uncharacterized protein n=1 Tax=Scomber scombrus TaxID=13677 RepID=A0AAV1NVB6_SCOSC